MLVLYNDQTKEVIVEGNRKDWNLFLKHLIEGESINLESPKNFEYYIDAKIAKKIIFNNHHREKLYFFVGKNNDSLIVEGNKEFILKLEGFIKSFLDNYQKGQHVHLDYQGENYFVDKDSYSVVLEML